MGIELKIEKITPKKAKLLLEGNTLNRNLRERVVDSYARDMEQGRWIDTGAPIRINCKDNLLLDGQHRLHAIVKSGRTVQMVIARGVPTTTMLNIDTGNRRKFSDNLKIMGYKNYANLAAACRWGVKYEDDTLTDPYDYRGTPTNVEMMDWLTANPRITDTVDTIARLKVNRTRGVQLALMMIKHYAGGHDFDIFLERFYKGIDLTEGSPVLALRRFVDNSAMLASKHPPKVLHGCTVKAWNAYVRGDEMAFVSFKNGGAKPEKFQKILVPGAS